MELEAAIRTRRTHKVFGAEPVDPVLVRELVELATWAPNHHLTRPWRFRLLGPSARQRLEAVAGDGAAKLRRAPTLVAVSALSTPEDPVRSQEDLLATGAAIYALLLAAHDRGLAAYWRTPDLLRRPEGCAALEIPATETVVGLVYLGPLRQPAAPPDRGPVEDVLISLD
ncbi:nitroreductase family protein [Conexibacter sp. DBS9H8]|uniref:nitroreductase family protein n=1 Tax=Conexibacter sp. DBS9H8 TaxID=2937801 RepID=UPI00200BDDE8|nr:nitroreductase family protein [Conexibacter sp. DBS9H8]